MALRTDGKLIALGSSNGSIRLLSSKSLKTLAIVQAHSSNVNRVLWHGLNFFTFGNDEKVACFLPYNK